MNNENSPSGSVSQSKKPVLSLILCSRNDNYMGNPRYRLEIALNYLAQSVQALGREDDVEVIVADWGSEVPLHSVVKLNPAAARRVSFVVIPPKTAREQQKDSPFSEVHALNAAARRVNGQFIGRIDQDTLVGKRFLEFFFDLYEGKRAIDTPVEGSLLFANRRSIPYRFADRCPAFGHVDRFIRWFASTMKVWNYNPHTKIFWTSYVGILLVHRDGWHEFGGYNEQLIYYDWMEVDLILRLRQKYPVVDLGKLTDYDFYHLDHYQLHASWSAVLHPRATSAKSNSYILDLDTPPEVPHPNGEDWGLRPYSLEIVNGTDVETTAVAQSETSGLVFILLLLLALLRSTWDTINLGLFRLVMGLRSFFLTYVMKIWWFLFAPSSWRDRVQTFQEITSGQPVHSWPKLLMTRFYQK